MAHLQLHGSINLHAHPQSFPADQLPKHVVKSITSRQGMFASFSVTPRGFEPAPQRQSCLPCWSQLPSLAAQTRANSAVYQVDAKRRDVMAHGRSVACVETAMGEMSVRGLRSVARKNLVVRALPQAKVRNPMRRPSIVHPIFKLRQSSLRLLVSYCLKNSWKSCRKTSLRHSKGGLLTSA